MTPFSSTSIRSAAGDFGRPGIVIISPVSATRKPAPAETRSSRTVTVKPWQPDRMHEVLKLYEYDDLLEEFRQAT